MIGRLSLNLKEVFLSYLQLEGDIIQEVSHTGSINIFYRELDDCGLNQFDLIGKISKEIGGVLRDQ